MEASNIQLLLNNTIYHILHYGTKTGKQIGKIHSSLERLFSIEGTDKVLDCMLSNYELKQKLDDVANFTKLQKEIVEKSLDALVKEEILKKIRDDNAYITNFKSDRLVGLFAYYRATLAENLSKLEFNKVSMQ